MTEPQIKSAVEFTAESGSRTHAMAILKINDKGEVETHFTGSLPAFCYMKDIFENYIQRHLTDNFKPPKDL
jgi:hypothetical protein